MGVVCLPAYAKALKQDRAVVQEALSRPECLAVWMC